MLQVNTGSSPVVLTGSVNRFRILKTSQILCKGFWGKYRFRSTPATHLLREIVFRICSNQVFWQTIWLNQKKPMVVTSSKLLISRLEHMTGRSNVHYTGLLHSFGMVEDHPVQHPSSTVMSCYRELLVSELSHDFDHILGHFTLRIRCMIRGRLWLGTITVSTQIRANHVVFFS